jgi:ParB family transcriptional regulator, chromosome partitioning protein
MSLGPSVTRSRSQILRQVDPRTIGPNPENPRLKFRQEEMESLLVSIDQLGIQVPLTIYRDDGDYSYRLLDGERRWRCALKLGLKAVPVIVQERPTELQNLVLMYNIHALREQWDYFTIAASLKRIIDLFEEENNYSPNERELSDLTGLTVGAIRRCRLIMELPERFKDALLVELDKPKSQQKLSEDFFIEMERALKTVVRRLPEYEQQTDHIRDVLIHKFQSGTITAVTDFRQLSKIATAIEGLGVAHRTAKRALDRVFDPSQRYGIKEAYKQTVEFEYFERRATREVEHLSEFIETVVEEERASELDDDTVNSLRALYQRLQQLLSMIG